MDRIFYHVFPLQNGGWKVRRGGAVRASKTFDVKEEAINFGRKLSLNHNGELVIHRKDGTILNANSYGVDPNPPKEKA